MNVVQKSGPKSPEGEIILHVFTNASAERVQSGRSNRSFRNGRFGLNLGAYKSDPSIIRLRFEPSIIEMSDRSAPLY